MDGGAIRNWSSSGLVRQPAAMLSGSNSIVIIKRLLRPSTSRLGKGGWGGGGHQDMVLHKGVLIYQCPTLIDYLSGGNPALSIIILVQESILLL